MRATFNTCLGAFRDHVVTAEFTQFKRACNKSLNQAILSMKPYFKTCKEVKVELWYNGNEMRSSLLVHFVRQALTLTLLSLFREIACIGPTCSIQALHPEIGTP